MIVTDLSTLISLILLVASAMMAVAHGGWVSRTDPEHSDHRALLGVGVVLWATSLICLYTVDLFSFNEKALTTLESLRIFF